MIDMGASDLARALGSRGGRARAARLSAAEKKRIAALGARARLESLLAARRIAANFDYLEAMRDLRTERFVVRQVRSCSGPLPGIYRSGS